MADQQKGLGERVGNEAHDATDTGNPLKIGGHANAALRSAVGEDDRVDLSCDLAGQVRVVNDVSTPLFVQGDIAHDATSSGNPVLMGGHANASLPSAVGENDRVRASYDLQGQLRVIATGSTGGTSAVDDSVFTGGATNLTPMGAIFDATPPSVTDGSVGTPRMSSTRILLGEVAGDVAHDDPDAGNPVKQGFKAVEFNVDPPTVNADDDRVDSIATPQGIQWVLGGHPNIISREYMTTAVQTVDPIIDSISAGSQIVITEIEVLTSAAGSTTPKVRIGFGTSAPPTEPTSGNTVDEVVLSHPGIAAGSGVVRGNGSGIVAIGADGAELRIANDVPTGGQITVLVNYYISTL